MFEITDIEYPHTGDKNRASEAGKETKNQK